MKHFLVAVLVATSLVSTAGSVDSLKQRPLQYAFSVNSSMSFCSTCAMESSLVAMPSTIHGIKYKNVRLGAGIGYTSFGQVRMMPYFGSLTISTKIRGGFFLQCDYGSARAWVAQVFQENNYLKHVTGKDFFQISAGYAYHYHKLRLATQLGFQSVRANKFYEYQAAPNQTFWGYVAPPPNNTMQDYEVRRIFLSISFGL